MPTKKSILGSQYGQAADLAAEIARDTSLPSAGFQDPPPGIKNGIAQLDEVKIDTYKSGENEGKAYFQATATILEPLSHVYTPSSQGKATGDPVEVHTAGMPTRIQIPIYDITPKTGKNMGKVTPWQEGAKKAAQFMRALGADTSKLRQVGDIESIAEALTRVARNPDTPIYLRFSTSVRQAQKIGDADGVWQNWHGTAGLEDYTPPEGSEVGTVDNSASVSNDDQQGEALASGASSGGGDDLSEAGLGELLEAAKGEEGTETPAQDELLRRAAEATGKTDEEINSTAESWEDVVAMIQASSEAGEAGAAETPPMKGDHFNYKPMEKKLGKMVKAKKDIEVLVTAVNEGKRTVDLKNTVDGKTVYKAVSWDDLEEIV